MLLKTKFENINNLTTDNIPPRFANALLSVSEIYKIMRKLLAKIIIKYFRKTYFVSGTFEHNNERKWFRIIYQPKTGFVNEKEVKNILELETGYVSKYVVVTFFKKVPFKQYQEF